MTGRPARPGSGVHTFTVSQSSPGMSGSGSSTSNGGAYLGLGGVAPNRSASLVPSQAGGGAGGRNRSGPVGLAAYGMPRKLATPSRQRPRTRPYLVVTVGF